MPRMPSRVADMAGPLWYWALSAGGCCPKLCCCRVPAAVIVYLHRGFLTYTAFLTGPSTFRCADYLIIPIIALIMGSSNLWGYFKCSREAKDQLSSMTSNIMTSAATSYMSNAMRGGGSTTAAADSARV